MARLTRQEAVVAAGTGLLLGALVALAAQWLRLSLFASIALAIVWATGLGAAMAQRKDGRR